MTPEREKKGTLYDELNDLIRRKQAENHALRKVQEQLKQGRELRINEVEGDLEDQADFPGDFDSAQPKDETDSTNKK